MTETNNVVELGRLIPFTIDGDPYETADLSQRAEALLRLAGRDPAAFDLGEIEGKDRPHTKRYRDDEIRVHHARMHASCRSARAPPSPSAASSAGVRRFHGEARPLARGRGRARHLSDHPRGRRPRWQRRGSRRGCGRTRRLAPGAAALDPPPGRCQIHQHK